MDKEWQNQLGSVYVQQALRVADKAQAMLSPGGVRPEPAYLGRWEPSTMSKGIVGLYPDLLLVDAGKGDIVVGFTAGYDGPEGGFTGNDRRHIVVKHHRYRLDHDALVLAHEIGHDLGLEHHVCPDTMCIMSAHDFDDARRHFCIDHLQLLRKNAGVFRYLEETGISA